MAKKTKDLSKMCDVCGGPMEMGGAKSERMELDMQSNKKAAPKNQFKAAGAIPSSRKFNKSVKGYK